MYKKKLFYKTKQKYKLSYLQHLKKHNQFAIEKTFIKMLISNHPNKSCIAAPEKAEITQQKLAIMRTIG